MEQSPDLIRALAVQHRTANPRAFGSVLTGKDREGSDLDVLVDVRTPMDLPPHIRADVLRRAVPI